MATIHELHLEARAALGAASRAMEALAKALEEVCEPDGEGPHADAARAATSLARKLDDVFFRDARALEAAMDAIPAAHTCRSCLRAAVARFADECASCAETGARDLERWLDGVAGPDPVQRAAVVRAVADGALEPRRAL